MDGLRAASALSPRRRREMRESASWFKRTSSNSSTSSDILVAGPPQTPTHQTGTPQHGSHRRSRSLRDTPGRPTRAWNSHFRLKIQFGPAFAKDKFRAIVLSKPKPLVLQSASDEDALVAIDRAAQYDVPGEFHVDESDDEHASPSRDGPNHRGTYSKEQTLRHPEITWVHRGQGRYLPVSEIRTDTLNISPRPTRQSNERIVTSVASSEQTMQDMTEALVQYLDDYRRSNAPTARENWTSTVRTQFDLVLNLIKTTPRQQWNRMIEFGITDEGVREVTRKWCKAMELQFPMHGSMEHDADSSFGRTRPPRQSRFPPLDSIEHRRSARITDGSHNMSYGDDDDDDDEESDDSQDPDMTFRREYVEAHPEEDFYHTGNGWFKRGSKPESVEKRRGSSNSHAFKSVSSEPSRELDANATIHGDDLHLYPGKIFHHKGNGWYRPGVAPNGRKGTIIIKQDGNTVSYRPGDTAQTKMVDDEDEVAHLPPGATVDKAFTMRHPNIEWVHRGQGRYKRKSSVFGSLAGTTTPAASSERRSSKVENSFGKDYAESHASDDLGLRRTSSRTTASKRTSRGFFDVVDSDTVELFDRAYVEAHPDEEFHHRGQGRWARGRRSKPVDHSDMAPTEDRVYYGTAYVKSHPEETFHHRGQGKWVRGLPPPGTYSNKTAVQRPAADSFDIESAVPLEENEDGEAPPPVAALLRKHEGPDKWPQFDWKYRGGGKWCRLSKEEALRQSNPGLRKQRPIAGRVKDGPEAQLRREARAAETAFKRRTGLGRRGRGRGPISKVSSNSDLTAAVPRPALLSVEEDQLEDEDLPSLYKDDWSDDEDEDIDAAGHILRKEYKPLISVEAFVKALTKHDPAVRSLDNLKQLAENAQVALRQLQDEYLELDEIVARSPMHGKKERKPVKGGRQLIDDATWEDRKEAMLYDYSFDPRKIGYQDPDAQRIIRDADGRELRRRRHRIDPHHSAVDYGDGEMTTKRTVKPVSRFDGVVIPPPRKRSRLTQAPDDGGINDGDITPSMTPERSGTPIGTLIEDAILNYKAPTRGRWKDHVPKRILELREESVASSRSGSGGSTSPKPGNTNPASPASGSGSVRKGRPPGSKNLHKRKDAGIKKGPRKPKIPSSSYPGGSPRQSMEPEQYSGYMSGGEAMDGVEMTDTPMPFTIPAIVDYSQGNMSLAAAPTRPMAPGHAADQAPSLAPLRRAQG